MGVLQPIPSVVTADNAAMSGPHRTESRLGAKDRTHHDGHDSSDADDDKFYEDGEEIYSKFSSGRKRIIVAVLGFGAFVALVSSTSVLPAVPEITESFHATDTIVEISNAIYIALTGVGCVVWGPMSQLYGRRIIIQYACAFFCCMSLGTALSPNLSAFFIFRALSAIGGSALTILGNVIISDIYKPTERATAISWYLSCTIIGPSFGPFMSGLVVQFASWRIIYWVQLGCAIATMAAGFFLIPETTHHKLITDMAHLPRRQKMAAIAREINPLRSVSLLRYLNVVAVSFASAVTLFALYCMLVPIRFVLNPRFGLESPLLSGVFYLVPGAGCLCSTIIAGRYGDWTAKRWIRKRGRRIPEDRLRACIPALAILQGGGVLIYGWTVDKAVGGMPVPLIFLFVQATGQIIASTMLNTYCLENTPSLSADIIAICWLVRYIGACIATAVALPMIRGIGVGWTLTINTALLVISSGVLMATVKWGESWRSGIVPEEKPAITTPVREKGPTDKV
ncbi:Efflux pump rdc3 [Beauveria bassiana]|nr:Efflux pump rdc3 [Beauveria bassiana]